MAFLQVHQIIGLRTIDIGNQNNFPIWIEALTNDNGAPISGIRKLDPQGRTTYEISDAGWAGRMWPKVGCHDDGSNCAFVYTS